VLRVLSSAGGEVRDEEISGDNRRRDGERAAHDIESPSRLAFGVDLAGHDRHAVVVVNPRVAPSSSSKRNDVR
jgi:hypothetical protein